MDIQKIHVTTSEEYVEFVRKFATLLDEQMSTIEKKAETEGVSAVVSQIPPIISLVNTMGYLRGQDGMFLDIRPSTAYQKEFYALEDMFEARLYKLVDAIMQSDQKQYYVDRLDKYYMKARAYNREVK